MTGTLQNLPAGLEHVSSQLLLDSLACLTKINISAVTVSRIQLISVFTAVSSDWSTLTSLNLSTLDLTPLPSSLFVQTLSSLTTIILNYANLSKEQTTAIIRAAAKSENLDTLGIHNMAQIVFELSN